MKGFFALWNRLLTSGIPPFHAADNPRVFLFVLAALALSVILSVVALTRKPDAKRSNAKRPDVAKLGWLVGALIVIYLSWLGFSTPIHQLFGFELDGFAGAVAMVAHGLLALLPAILAFIWQGQMDLDPHGIWSAITDFAVAGALIAALDGQTTWPADMIVALQALVTYIIFLGIIILINKFPDGSAIGKICTALVFAGWTVAIIAILIRHAAQTPLVALCGIYLALIWLDGLAAVISNMHPRRYLVTVPLALAIGMLGAANLFTPLLHSNGFTFDTWLEAAGASAAFLLIAPYMDRVRSELTEQARNELAAAAAARGKQQEMAGHWFRRGAALLLGLGDQLQREIREAADTGKAHSRAARMLRHLVEDLNGVTAAFFFALLVAYYLIIEVLPAMPDPITFFRPLVGATLVGLAGIVFNFWLRSGLNVDKMYLQQSGKQSTQADVVARAALSSVDRVVGAFGFLIGLIYGFLGQLDAIGSPSNGGDAEYPPVVIAMLTVHPPTVGVAPGVLLSNPGFWVAAGRVVFAVTLLMIVCGQSRLVSSVREAQQVADGAPARAPGALAGATESA